MKKKEEYNRFTLKQWDKELCNRVNRIESKKKKINLPICVFIASFEDTEKREDIWVENKRSLLVSVVIIMREWMREKYTLLE